MPSTTSSPSPALARALVWTGCLLLALVFVKNAWVCEDAYINFRSLDQLFAGNGPIWNPHARVQVYTSVLWYWMSAALALLYRDYFIVVLLLSAFCGWLATRFTLALVGQGALFLLLAIIFVCSRSLSDYSSSGLENPLAYALLAAFVYYILQVTAGEHSDSQRQRAWSSLCLVTGIAPLVRHDLVLLLAIPFGYVAWHAIRQRDLPLGRQQWLLLLGPLLVWSSFSLLYYGYPFPNTAYAKLGGGIARSALIDRSITYLQAHLIWDPVIIATLLAGALGGFFSRSAIHRALALGLCTYLAYLIWIGSDYMLGRMLAAPSLYGLLVLASLSRHPAGNGKAVMLLLLATALLGVFGTVRDPTNKPLFSSIDWGFKKGDAPMPILDHFDVRFGEYPYNSLWSYWNARRGNAITGHNWCQKGLQAANQKLVTRGPVGMFGYCAGPQLIIIDSWGIADALLAHLPGDNSHWRPGHFTRSIPAGYAESLLSGENRILDPSLALYYDQVRLITESKTLWSISRLQSIIKMNLGYNNHLLENIAHGSR